MISLLTYLAATYLFSQPLIWWGCLDKNKTDKENGHIFLRNLLWAPIFWPLYFAGTVSRIINSPGGLRK